MWACNKNAKELCFTHKGILLSGATAAGCPTSASIARVPRQWPRSPSLDARERKTGPAHTSHGRAEAARRASGQHLAVRVGRDERVLQRLLREGVNHHEEGVNRYEERPL